MELSVVRDYEEKRDYNRMPVKTEVQFTLNDEETLYIGLSQDLSATGILISADCDAKSGDNIEVMIQTDDDRFAPFLAKGVVIRAAPDPDHAEHVLISAQFHAME
jgi:hypothetical protein